MRSFTFTGALALSLSALQLIAAAAVNTPAIHVRDAIPVFPYDPETTADCTSWYGTVGAIDCPGLLARYSLPITQFVDWNPSITLECGNFRSIGWSYCIQVSAPTEPTDSVTSETISTTSTTTTPPITTPPTTTTTPPTTATTSIPGNGITTPTPFQEGMTTSCIKFRLIKLNDQCSSIASEAGISLADFYKWNPAVGSQCTSLWAENYVCIGIIGSTSTQPVGNGIATPSPIQPRMTNHCNKFRLIKAGDQCGSIASIEGISLEEFYEWNPSVGRSCTSLWADAYVCVGLLGCTITPDSGHYCGRVGFPIAATGSGEISKHTSGPFVASVENCSGNCMGTPGCTGFHFREGNYCSLRYGPVAFSPNGNAGSSAFYESACINCPPTVPVVNVCPLKSPQPSNIHCGRVGIPITKTGTGRILTYDEDSPYVSSRGACAAKCLNTPACTSFYFTQSSRCSLQYGAISFSPNGNPGSAQFYDAECFSCPSTSSCEAPTPFPEGTHCGRVGVPIASSGSGTLLEYGAGTPYVTSLGVCAAQCVDLTPCTGLYFVAGSKCKLQYGPVSFSPNGNAGSMAFWDQSCFSTC